MRPCRDTVVDESLQRIAQVRNLIRSSSTGPPAVAPLRHQEKTKLGHDPDDACRESRGDDETREAAQSRLGHGGEGGGLLVLAVELDGLQGADIAGHEGEDGDTDAALDKDAEKGQLKHPRRCAIRRGRKKEIAVESARNVGENHEGGGETTQTLERTVCD